jgi:hypothetical protein
MTQCALVGFGNIESQAVWITEGFGRGVLEVVAWCWSLVSCGIYQKKKPVWPCYT